MEQPVNPENIREDRNYEEEIIRQLDEAIDRGDIDEDTACYLISEWIDHETPEEMDAQMDLAIAYVKAINDRKNRNAQGSL